MSVALLLLNILSFLTLLRDDTTNRVQWLDNLEQTDPEGYKQLIATMQAQIESGGAGGGSGFAGAGGQQGDANAALFEMLGSAKGGAAGGGSGSAGVPGDA